MVVLGGVRGGRGGEETVDCTTRRRPAPGTGIEVLFKIRSALSQKLCVGFKG